MSFGFERRTRAFQSALGGADADAAVLSPSPDMTYLSGFEETPGRRLLALFVPMTGDPVFVVPEMYREQVAENTWVDDVRTWPWAAPEESMTVVETLFDEHGLAGGRLLVEDRMWMEFGERFRKLLPEATFGLASEAIEELRITKTDRELRALEAAASLSDTVAVELRELGADVVGKTERELATEIKTRLSGHGSAGVSFEPMIGSGPNGAKPHHRNGDRTIERGDPVLIDFGGVIDGYCGDQTRTIVFDGAPPAEFETIHETVRRAQARGVETVEAGITAEAVDEAVREVIEDAGYGDAYFHRTGHGVGLELHEPPFLRPGNDRTLEPGMVCSVEPGVYLPDRFGVRIEDLVVVTEDGCERLNETPRGWRP